MIKAWYSDEHALTLGGGTVSNLLTSNYNTTTHAGYASPVNTGTPATDPFGRPLRPALFITDITNNLTSRAGDWQNNRTSPGVGPDEVFGTWKSSRAADPTANKTSLTANGFAGDPFQFNVNTSIEAYGSEVRWSVASLKTAGLVVANHVYRMQFMVHDGDQNKGGGDVGQGCANIIVK
jgi:hypothetical protein